MKKSLIEISTSVQCLNFWTASVLCTTHQNILRLIQKELQPRTNEDGYDLKFVLRNNLDNGLFGAVTRCAKVVDTVASLLGKFLKDNFQKREILTHLFPIHPFSTHLRISDVSEVREWVHY